MEESHTCYCGLLRVVGELPLIMLMDFARMKTYNSYYVIRFFMHKNYNPYEYDRKVKRHHVVKYVAINDDCVNEPAV